MSSSPLSSALDVSILKNLAIQSQKNSLTRIFIKWGSDVGKQVACHTTFDLDATFLLSPLVDHCWIYVWICHPSVISEAEIITHLMAICKLLIQFHDITTKNRFPIKARHGIILYCVVEHYDFSSWLFHFLFQAFRINQESSKLRILLAWFYDWTMRRVYCFPEKCTSWTFGFEEKCSPNSSFNIP